MRYIHLDGLRGLLLISMVLGHLGSGLSLGVTHNLVFKVGLINDAASAFVFLSGLTVGLAYTKGWIDSRFAGRKKDLRARALLIFFHHAFLVLVATLGAVLALATDSHPWIIEPFGAAPALFGLLSVSMVAAGWFLDILPMYVLFLLLTPAALSAIAANRRWMVVALASAAWIAGQTGLLEAMWQGLAEAFGLQQHKIELGLNFNRLAWSALYFSGLLFGSAYVRKEFDLAVLKHPRFAPLALGCLVLIACTMLAFSLYTRGIITEHVAIFAGLIDKPRLGLLSLLNFLATVFLVTWLLVAGPSSPYRSMQVLGTRLSGLLSSRPLVLLGQNSLSVFSFHVVGVYLFYMLVDASRFEPWSANVILLAGVASLAIPALIGRYLKDRKRQVLPVTGAEQNP